METQTPTSQKAVPFDARVELFNGRIVDVTSGRYFPENVRIILHQGRIAAMPGLPGEPIDLPCEFAIDLQGKAVIPGLFNTHCHLQMKYPSMLATMGDMMAARKLTHLQIEKNLAACQARGITHLRDALTTDLRPNRSFRERIAKGELPGPRLYQSVLISPQGGVYASSQGLLDYLVSFVAGTRHVGYDDPAAGLVVLPAEASPQQVRDAVDRAIDERRADSIKLYDQLEFVPTYRPGAQIMTQAQVDAAADQSRRRGIPCTMHHTTIEGFRRGARAGVTSLAHLPLDGALTPEDAQVFKNAGSLIEPTVSLAYFLSWALPGAAWQNHPRLEQLDAWRARTCDALMHEHWLPELSPSAAGMFAKAGRGQFKMLGLLDMSGAFRYWGGCIGQGIDNLLLLLEAGVPIACGSDAGAIPASEAMVGLEIALLHLLLNPQTGPARFTPADALCAATLHSACALGVEADFGSIRSGKIADLVILDGDPLNDIQRIGCPADALFVEGRLVLNACGL